MTVFLIPIVKCLKCFQINWSTHISCQVFFNGSPRTRRTLYDCRKVIENFLSSRYTFGFWDVKQNRIYLEDFRPYPHSQVSRVYLNVCHVIFTGSPRTRRYKCYDSTKTIGDNVPHFSAHVFRVYPNLW